MLANMAASLILHKRITTTLAKAKALKTYIEPLITKSKEDSTPSRRIVFSYLQNKQAVTELFREVSAKVANRPGGYTRILKLGNRSGDSAEMAYIELVDFNDYYSKEAAEAKPKARTTRRGRSTKKAAASTETEAKAPETESKAQDEPVAAAPGPEEEEPSTEEGSSETPPAGPEGKPQA
jgi:large subunit ribosomal protein L17